MEAGLAQREEEEEEEGEVACECCGFTEECTARYIAGVRGRYGGRWICGLCGDAVAEEMGRAPAISPAEALDRHARVCGGGRGALAPPSPSAGPGDDELIAALRLLLRRRLGSPPRPPQQRRMVVRSTPSNPMRDGASAATGGGGGGIVSSAAGSSLARTESCFAALVE